MLKSEQNDSRKTWSVGVCVLFLKQVSDV